MTRNILIIIFTILAFAQILIGQMGKQLLGLGFRLLFVLGMNERDVEQLVGTGVFHDNEIRFHEHSRGFIQVTS